MSGRYRLLATPVATEPLGDAATALQASDRAGQFVAVTGAESEQVDASVMVVTAYAAFWVLAITFVYLTHRKQRQLQARVEELEERLRDHSSETRETSES